MVSLMKVCLFVGHVIIHAKHAKLSQTSVYLVIVLDNLSMIPALANKTNSIQIILPQYVNHVTILAILAKANRISVLPAILVLLGI